MKKYQSSFGEVEDVKIKKEKFYILDNFIPILFILSFPFLIAGIVVGIHFKRIFVLILSASVFFLFITYLIYAVIASFLTLKKGKTVVATAVKVRGSKVTYQYVDEKSILRVGSAFSRRPYKYIKGSVVNIKIYKGRSIIADY